MGPADLKQSEPPAFIWSVADLLRGDFKQSDYGKIILPFTVLRLMDCVLEATKAAVLKELAEKQANQSRSSLFKDNSSPRLMPILTANLVGVEAWKALVNHGTKSAPTSL
jgi:type I restriction-modification system DNA methylase subunit